MRFRNTVPAPENTRRKTRFVRDLSPEPGEIEELFLIARAVQGKAKNGPYWTLTLQDATGQVEAKVWSPLAQAFNSFTPGHVALVKGRTGAYQDRLQVVVDRLAVFDPLAPGPNDPVVDMDQLTITSDVPPEDLMARLATLLRENLHYPPWRKLCEKALDDPEIRAAMLAAPGGKAIHHAYRGGLLEHTLSVSELAVHMAAHYPNLDGQILLAAAAFHDLGKAFELMSDPAPDYTDQGRLLGHIQLGLERISPFLAKCGADPDLILHFKHIILSHHGEYEYGSPKRPKTAEAMLLHYLDNLDAKMNQFAGAFPDADEDQDAVEAAGNGEPGRENGKDPSRWSPYQTTLQRFLYKPKPTPNGESKAKKQAKKDSRQCSLPLKA